jgi:hypothetical protein
LLSVLHALGVERASDDVVADARQLRSAEFGFFGVIVFTCVQTPRR